MQQRIHRRQHSSSSTACPACRRSRACCRQAAWMQPAGARTPGSCCTPWCCWQRRPAAGVRMQRRGVACWPCWWVTSRSRRCLPARAATCCCSQSRRVAAPWRSAAAQRRCSVTCCSCLLRWRGWRGGSRPACRGRTTRGSLRAGLFLASAWRLLGWRAAAQAGADRLAPGRTCCWVRSMNRAAHGHKACIFAQLPCCGAVQDSNLYWF